jgi:nucleoside-diphosphate-sugar epimerase
MHVLVTGATGFIGRVTVELLSPSVQVTAAVRNASSRLPSTVRQVIVGDLSAETDWAEALEGVTEVIHLAGRAHILKEIDGDGSAQFKRVNVDAAKKLFQQAQERGVERFVFVSSIGVNGSGQDTHYQGSGYKGSDPPCPCEPYSVTKLEAERLLQQTELNYVIVRPPLVYGPEVPGNMRVLLDAVAMQKTLPIKGVRNRRSFISVRNLADFLCRAAETRSPERVTVTVADQEVISSPKLAIELAGLLGVKPNLVSLPLPLVKVAAGVLGRKRTYQSLFGSLVVDSSEAIDLFRWVQPETQAAGMRKMTDWYKAEVGTKR